MMPSIASIRVYTPSGVRTSLPDYGIAPQPGSVNPWQREAAPGGRLTVTIRPDPAPGQANTVPLPSGTISQHLGYLVRACEASGRRPVETGGRRK